MDKYPSITFNSSGKVKNLSPYHVDVIKFQNEYCYNLHRQAIYQTLIDMIDHAKNLNVVTEQVWVGGSFIEASEKKPNDIDVLLALRFTHKKPNIVDFRKSTQRFEKVFSDERKPVDSKNLDCTFLWLKEHPIKNLERISHWTNLNSYNRSNPNTRRPILIITPK